MNYTRIPTRDEIINRISEHNKLVINSLVASIVKAINESTSLPIVLPSSLLGEDEATKSYIVKRLQDQGWRVEANFDKKEVILS